MGTEQLIDRASFFASSPMSTVVAAIIHTKHVFNIWLLQSYPRHSSLGEAERTKIPKIALRRCCPNVFLCGVLSLVKPFPPFTTLVALLLAAAWPRLPANTEKWPLLASSCLQSPWHCA